MTDDTRIAVDARVGRRDALKIGGLTISLAALVAACGDDLGGSTDPGRVGVAPPVTAPPEYPVDAAVLLRTGSSLEQSTIMVYEAILALGILDAEGTALVESITENHRSLVDVMGELTVAAGGEVWPCGNPWMDERFLVPIVEAIKTSDNPERDIYNVAVSLENLGAATYQQFTVELTEAEQRSAVVQASAQDSRNSAALVIAVEGPEGYVSPALEGLEVGVDADGVPLQYAIPWRFGSVAQFELIVGAPSAEGGTREDFTIQTPSLNSYIYNELVPDC
jgi:hypothetical protein